MDENCFDVSTFQLRLHGTSESFGDEACVVQIEREQCDWFGREECAPWRAMLIALAFCVIVDVVNSFAVIWVGRALELSPKAHLRKYGSILLSDRSAAAPIVMHVLLLWHRAARRLHRMVTLQSAAHA